MVAIYVHKTDKVQSKLRNHIYVFISLGWQGEGKFLMKKSGFPRHKPAEKFKGESGVYVTNYIVEIFQVFLNINSLN